MPSADVGPTRDTTRSLSGASTQGASASGRFDGAYAQLKQRVSSLKQEQQRVYRNQRTAEEMDSVVLLEQRYRYEASIKQLEEKLTTLQEQLKANTDRSAKMRLHFEREKKALAAQLDQTKRTLENIEEQHAAQVDALKASHGEQVEALTLQLEQVQEAAATQAASDRAAHAAALEEVDQWCTGEVEAVRHVEAQQRQALEQEVARWQSDFEQQRSLRVTAEEAAREAEEQLSMAQEEVVRLTAALANSQMAHEALQRESEQATLQHQEALRTVQETALAEQQQQATALKARQAQQLELINTRVQDVIVLKDATITALRAELAEVHGQLQQLL